MLPDYPPTETRVVSIAQTGNTWRESLWFASGRIATTDGRLDDGAAFRPADAKPSLRWPSNEHGRAGMLPTRRSFRFQERSHVVRGGSVWHIPNPPAVANVGDGFACSLPHVASWNRRRISSSLFVFSFGASATARPANAPRE